MDDRPRYMISVAAEMVGMHPQTLRIYEQKGLVRPKRTAGNTRLYSDADVARLRLIQQLTTEVGLNLAGAERVLLLEDELERMRRRLARMEQEMRTALLLFECFFGRDDVVFDQIVAKDHADFFVLDERFGKTESVGDATLSFLVGVVYSLEAKFSPVSKKAKKIARMLTTRDDDDVSNSRIRKCLNGIENHGAVKDRQKVLVGDSS